MEAAKDGPATAVRVLLKRRTDMLRNGVLLASAATLFLFANFSRAAAPMQPCATFEFVGDAHPTGVSGSRGKGIPVELGDPNSGSSALWGLYSEETSWTTNDPCWVRAAWRSVNDAFNVDSARADRCGTKKPQDDTLLGADYSIGDFTGPGVFVSGVSVCLNNDGTKVKGWRLNGKKINADGTLTDVNRAIAGPRANCPSDESGWRPFVNCAAGELATAAEIHFAAGSDARDWIGIELQCRALKVREPISAPTQPGPFQALKVDADHVLVSVNGDTPGVQVLSADSLKSLCVNPIATNGVNNIRLAPGSADIGVGIKDAGIAFFQTDDLVHCRKPNGIRVSQVWSGTLDVAFTLDGQFAFVLNEGGPIGLVKIEHDAVGHIAAGTQLLGFIPLQGNYNAGMTLSPDGKRLYVSSELVNDGVQPPGVGNTILYDDQRCAQPPHFKLPTGLLTVIDVAKATHGQTTGAIISAVGAGCGPTRIVETADGSTLWVAARDDNRLLAFGASKLESKPEDSLIGYADTGGDRPVGLAFIHNERFLVVANSNRFYYSDNNYPGRDIAGTNAVIMDVSKPAAPKVVCQLRTGAWPREATVDPDGATVYLTDYASAKLQAISTIQMPAP
jgi:DNA-binding beta-propeller fold protein YncE